MKPYPRTIDLHLHSAVSDGTDEPEEIAGRVREAGIELFALTDHDAVTGCTRVREHLREGDPAFLSGVEFSCKDEEGNYHILGYAYEESAPAICAVVDRGHAIRMNKLQKRLDFLESEFGFTFSKEDLDSLFALSNPGKPHIGNLMVKYGYAPTKEEAIKRYLDLARTGRESIRPEEAIDAILRSGGVPVLAHPLYGRGDELILGEEMDRRILRLTGYGLQGVEAFYSGFTPKLQEEALSFARRYHLFVTAGSDYHGKNKMVRLGDNNLPSPEEFPEELLHFLSRVLA